MTTIQEYIEKTDHIRDIHQHLGFIAGVSTALQLMREHNIDVYHPAREAVYALLMETTSEKSAAIIAELGKWKTEAKS